MARQLLNLPVVLSIITIIIILYALIARSAEVYRTTKQLLIVVFISLGASYVLSAVLLLFLRLDYILVIMIATLMTFIIGHFGSTESDVSDVSNVSDVSDVSVVSTDEDDEAREEADEVPNPDLGHISAP